MAARDSMEFINEQDQATLDRFVERLEFRGKDPTFVGYRDAYVKSMGLTPSTTVLDLGCGTGVVARALALGTSLLDSHLLDSHLLDSHHLGTSGQITGVDQSPVLIEAARRLAAEEGVGRRVRFLTGDVHSLDLPGEAFDAVIANTLVSHVTNPPLVLKHTARVVRPGGVVVIFDGDYASLTYGCGDPELGTAMEHALLGAIVSNPRVMRDMPRLLRQAGLSLEEMQPHLYADVGTSRFFLSLAEAYAPLVVREKLLAWEQVDAWLAGQRQAHEEGTFFAACNYYAYIARRPADPQR